MRSALLLLVALAACGGEVEGPAAVDAGACPESGLDPAAEGQCAACTMVCPGSEFLEPEGFGGPGHCCYATACGSGTCPAPP